MKKILSLAIAGLLFTADAYAALTANSVVTAQTPNRGVQQYLGGTDTAGTYKTVYTAGANGSKITALFMNNNDTVTHLVTCQIVSSAPKSFGGVALTTVASAGFASGTPPQSLMTSAIWPGLPVDGNANPYIYLISGDTLQCTFATTITGSDVINVVAVASDF